MKTETEEMEEREMKKDSEQITKFFFKNFGDELIEKLVTLEASDEKSHLRMKNYYCDGEVDIDLGRINVYDAYDKRIAREWFGEDFEREVEADPISFFKVTFDFEGYVKRKIEEQATSKEIKKLYNWILTELYFKESVE